MVRSARLELARVAPPPPQDGVSANSTTTAYKLLVTNGEPTRNRTWAPGSGDQCSIP